MSHPDRRVAVAGLLLAAIGVAWACGADFLTDPVLEYREAALLKAPAHSFTRYVQTLVPQEHPELQLNEAEAEGANWEQEHLPADQREPVAQMRAAPDADAAYAAGEGLPPALRHYVAGAVGFAQQQAGNGGGEAAEREFRAVLGLPPAQNRSHAVWAAWMLGRLYRDDDTHAADAQAAYAQVRQLALDGADDPLGLAVASYGEQARLALRAGDLDTATRLYAQQASYGSLSARNSLLRVADRLMSPRTSLDALKDPLLQRLSLAYALELDEQEFGFSWSQEFQQDGVAEEDEETADGDGVEPSDSARSEAADGAPDEARVPPEDSPLADDTPPSPALLRLLARIQALPESDWADPVPLAVAAYRAGRYDDAERFAKVQLTAESELLLAKLAVRKADLTAARQHYGEAARLAGEAPPALEAIGRQDGTAQRQSTLAEWSAATLAQGAFVEALHLMLQAGPDHWAEAAYIAERVLSTEELKTYVDAQVPAPDAEAIAKVEAAYDCWPLNACLPGGVRRVLARRLMREGRGTEALAYYFGNVRPAGAPEESPTVPLVQQARDYLDALQRSQHAWTASGRARGAFEAARLARRQGLELMGYENWPDYALLDGNSSWFDTEGRLTPQPLLSAEELQRYAASTPALAKRFHYRYLAANLAQAAASELPPRSQAFASVLCHATRWMLARDPEAAAQLYRRYLREGAWVPWGASFGQECPEPDFDAAADLKWRQQLQALRLSLRPWRTAIYGGAGLMVVATVVLVLSKRRRGTPA